MDVRGCELLRISSHLDNGVALNHKLLNSAEAL